MTFKSVLPLKKKIIIGQYLSLIDHNTLHVPCRRDRNIHFDMLRSSKCYSTFSYWI